MFSKKRSYTIELNESEAENIKQITAHFLPGLICHKTLCSTFHLPKWPSCQFRPSIQTNVLFLRLFMPKKFLSCLDFICILQVYADKPPSSPLLSSSLFPLPVSLCLFQPCKIPLTIRIIMSVSFLSTLLFLLLNFYSSLSQKSPTQNL